ncbi:glycogen debranching enzyme [Emericellopsis atlantica]|uniref:Glycogen debranching enzyme n=1 Tax=Emericellopsis atlantica TaxID=2614577 RepID=A0A9P7ZRM8_9HYPO|nr:glycogen debranching enzyme [Emericellopsis atlantica]KAG9256841.1 glycogen debranching enzyme [Emericellopsis atlantica]
MVSFRNAATAAVAFAVASASTCHVCPDDPTRFVLSDPPYTDYFYSDCNSAAQVVVTSPLPQSNLSIIGPRLLIAWPAGNSGAAAFFAPQNGVNGSLAIELVNSTTTGNALDPIYEPGGDNPIVGVTGRISFNSSATLVLPILGSIRTIRDFTEGPSLLQPIIQDAIETTKFEQGGFSLSRLWLDNVTTTTLSFEPVEKGCAIRHKNDTSLHFDAGVYTFNASFNYPQLVQLSSEEVLADSAQGLIEESPELTQPLSFLSYTDKLLAGAWRFLTYFGRDSMISMLLMSDILSPGEGGAWEAGIGALLERVNKTDGSAAHEETIGDYATYLNMQEGVMSTDPMYDYKMVDTDYFLPIVLAEYFIKNPVGKGRVEKFLGQKATEDPDNAGLTYRDLANLNAEKVMNITAPFASEGGQVQENLLRLKEGEIVGEWRDSNNGLGGGRIPYDVNAAIAPAGLRAISSLATAGFFPNHPDWAEQAAAYAQVFEDETLHFFEVDVSQEDAVALVDDYVSNNDFAFSSQTSNITSDVRFYGLALEGNSDNQDLVKVMNTDDCFRHFLLNTTNQTQLSSFISQTADHILAPFPVGLTTDVGLFVANPAYGSDPIYSTNFTNADYHGTVVWGWQLSMMAKGLERQLGRCLASDDTPDFCRHEALHSKVLSAYHRLWDVIDENRSILSNEVWSWKYEEGEGFVAVPLGDYSPTESNIRQLWSLTFLAVKRNEALK